MSSLGQQISSTGKGAAALMVGLAVVVGVVLGVLTKGALWLYNTIIDVIWDWLPAQFGVESDAVLFMAAVLVSGGIVVGIGQRTLGYLPKPLEETTLDVTEGRGVDYRSVPSVLGNTLPALGAGAPLGPESGLIAVLGGAYFWFKERMEASATHAFRMVSGSEVGEASRPWRLAPPIIAGVTLIIMFHWLPGTIDLSFVPAAQPGNELGALATALGAGIIAGGVGIAMRHLEDRVRGLALFDRAPLLSAPVGGLIVALLAVPTSLVLFSGAEDMAALFDRGTDSAELLYAGGAKLVAVVVVIAAGWKGGTIFPLMFIAGALAVGVADATGLDPSVTYAAAIAGAVAGHLRSLPLGAFVALLVVPTSLLLAIIVGAAGGVAALRAFSHAGGEGEPSTS
jgi:H+/Cl- antiporter ClcA